MVPRRMCWRIVELVTPTTAATSATNRWSSAFGFDFTTQGRNTARRQPIRAEAIMAPASSTTLTVRTVEAATGSSTDQDP